MLLPTELPREFKLTEFKSTYTRQGSVKRELRLDEWYRSIHINCQVFTIILYNYAGIGLKTISKMNTKKAKSVSVLVTIVKTPSSIAGCPD